MEFSEDAIKNRKIFCFETYQHHIIAYGLFLAIAMVNNNLRNCFCFFHTEATTEAVEDRKKQQLIVKQMAFIFLSLNSPALHARETKRDE